MGTGRLVFIRTDGNTNIATGHLMRCLSIAQACLKLGMSICFLVSDTESESLLKGFLSDAEISLDSFPPENPVTEKNFCFMLCVPDADYQNLNQEIPKLLPFLSNICKVTGFTLSHAVFFLDSYYVTAEYLKALNEKIKTAYLDDLQLFDYPVSLIINYDIIPEASMAAYQKAYQNASRALLGGHYTPLRSQFQNTKPQIRDKVKNILFTTGGSDPYHFCLKLLDAVQNSRIFSQAFASFSFSDMITLHLVIGKLNIDKDRLYELEKKLPFLKLHENVADMAALMCSCDLAISAAGTTLYELCALGVPSISYTMADNQIVAAQAFDDTIPYAGDIRTQEEQIIQVIFSFMTEMSELKDKRISASTKMQKLVDGNGSTRIGQALLDL